MKLSAIQKELLLIMNYRPTDDFENDWVKPVGFTLFTIKLNESDITFAQYAIGNNDSIIVWKYHTSPFPDSITEFQYMEAQNSRDLFYFLSDNSARIVPELKTVDFLKLQLEL